jgi:hypothetical protein
VLSGLPSIAFAIEFFILFVESTKLVTHQALVGEATRMTCSPLATPCWKRTYTFLPCTLHALQPMQSYGKGSTRSFLTQGAAVISQSLVEQCSQPRSANWITPSLNKVGRRRFACFIARKQSGLGGALFNARIESDGPLWHIKRPEHSHRLRSALSG